MGAGLALTASISVLNLLQAATEICWREQRCGDVRELGEVEKKTSNCVLGQFHK